MDLATLTMPKAEAAERLAEYEQQLAIERNPEDEAIAMGYRSLARGLPIIRLSETIRAGGFFGPGRPDEGFPRLGIGKADEADCRVHWDGGGLIYFHGDWLSSRGALVGKSTVRVPNIERPARTTYYSGRALMPLIPPRHRPRPARLRHCHILWEVESWDLIPPRDPALLRHIRGDLWAVLATWDLTDLERAVLAGRARG
jgi:hypothetical protein